MKLPDTFILSSSAFNPYYGLRYGLRYGIHMHWDKEEHWDNSPLRHDFCECPFICCRYHETYIFVKFDLLKIYINTYLKDFLKDYE